MVGFELTPWCGRGAWVFFSLVLKVVLFVGERYRQQYLQPFYSVLVSISF